MSNARHFSIRFPASISIAVMAIVACGPNKNYVPVQVANKSEMSRAVAQCEAHLRRNSAKVGHNVRAEKRTVAICQKVEVEGYEDSDLSAAAHSSLENSSSSLSSEATQPGYQWVEHPVRYRVLSKNKKIEIQIQLGIKLPANTTKAAADHFGQFLHQQCLPQIKNLFKRSSGEREVLLNLDTTSYKLAEHDSYDQVLNIVSAPELDLESGSESHQKADHQKYPKWQMSQWPDQATFYPLGHSDSTSKLNCKSKFGTDRENCEIEFDKLNEPFCRQLAQMTGHWLGLKAPRELGARCDQAASSSPLDQQEHETLNRQLSEDTQVSEKLGLAKSANPSYMKAVVAAKNEGFDFWKSAKLSPEDLGVILGPACRQIVQVGRNEIKVAAVTNE